MIFKNEKWKISFPSIMSGAVMNEEGECLLLVRCCPGGKGFFFSFFFFSEKSLGKGVIKIYSRRKQRQLPLNFLRSSLGRDSWN